MSNVQSCPHCGAQTRPGSFCESCGKAISVAQSGPVVVEGSSLASTGAGKKLQSEQLAKQSRVAAIALLVVAILSLLGLGALLVIFNQAERAGNVVDWSIATPILVVQGCVTAIFFALWWWARKSPLPAAIVGLAIYGSLILINALISPQDIWQGLLVKAIIIIVLLKAIGAGLQHRKLMQESPHA